MSSQVYFTDLVCTQDDSRLKKLIRLIKKAGINKIDFKDKYVAVKLHFGEWGNMAFPRHQYARVLCDYIKSRGGRPFLTDANTLYAGKRHNALDHLDTANWNGFSYLSTGVHCLIADGLRGTDERFIPVEGGKHIKEARVASLIVEADIIITLTHFKGHINAGFGGTLKNVGMGCASKMGKMEMHTEGSPLVDTSRCIGCGMCERNCLYGGIHVVDKKAQINEENCVGCGHCFSFCPRGALDCRFDIAEEVLSEKLAEYTWATLHGKPSFHISMVTDVSPDCDCDPGNDVPVVPDVGFFASFDPVAIDQACVDAVNSQPIMPNSVIGKYAAKKEHGPDCSCHDRTESIHGDVFKMIHPDSAWEAGLIRGEEMGLGTRDYKLIKVK